MDLSILHQNWITFSRIYLFTNIFFLDFHSHNNANNYGRNWTFDCALKPACRAVKLLKPEQNWIERRLTQWERRHIWGQRLEWTNLKKSLNPLLCNIDKNNLFGWLCPYLNVGKKLRNHFQQRHSSVNKNKPGHVGSNIFCRERFKNLLSLINRKVYIFAILGSIYSSPKNLRGPHFY